MRTTITLDDDVAELLKNRVRETGESFKGVVNDALRAGLDSRPERPARRYGLRPASLGAAERGVDLDAALRLADGLEDGCIATKLELRK